MQYTTKQINSTFKIKVAGLFEGKKINTLVGVSGLLNIVEEELVEKMLRKAFVCREDKQVCKLRRGIKVTFYYY